MGGTEHFVGQRIRGYEIEGRIGQGGMASVYAATHQTLGRRAAIKILAAPWCADPSFLQRLRREAEIVNAIRHPNLIDIFDLVELEAPAGVACIMELLHGPTLAQAVRRGPFTVVQSLNIALQLADALAAVHALGVVHRDVKPHNVILVGDRRGALDECPSVKLLDFGIAKVPVTRQGAPALTEHGRVMGTPAYMAPEQVVGGPISPSTDLYALAEVLYELLTGHRLFRGTTAEVLARKLDISPLPLTLAPEIPGADRLLALLHGCLAAYPEHRPPYEEVQQTLRELLAEADLADPQAPVEWSPIDVQDPAALFEDAAPTADDELGSDQSALLAQIIADFQDVLTPPPPAATPRSTLEADEPLELMTPEECRALWQHLPVPPAPLPIRRPTLPPTRETPRADQGNGRDAPGPPGEATKVAVPPLPPRAPARWARRLATGLVAVTVAASLAAFDSSRMTSLERAERIVEQRRITWTVKHGAVVDSLDTLLARAQIARRRDVEPSFGVANRDLERAVLIDGTSGVPLAAWVENQLVWKREALTALELEELSGFCTLALFRAPKDPAVTRAAAQLALRRGELVLAGGYVHQALSEQPDQPDALLAQAEIVAATDVTAGLDLLNGAIVAHLPRARRVEAAVRAKAGYTWSARRAIEARATDFAEDSSLGVQLAEILVLAGRASEAHLVLTQAKQAPGDSTRARLVEGALYEVEGRHDLAKVLLLEVGGEGIAAGAVRANALAKVARLEAQAGRWAEAEVLAHQALAFEPNSAPAQLTLAERALSTGDAAAAASIAAAAIGDGGGVEAESLLASALFARGENLEAMRVARRALPSANEHPEVLAIHGALALLTGDPASARQSLVELLRTDLALAANPRSAAPSPVVLSYLASVLHAQGPYSPEWPVAEAVAAVLWACAGQESEARAALLGVPEPALKAPALTVLGHRSLARSATRDASVAMGAVFKISPDAPAALLLAARLAEHSQNGPAAQAFYREAVRQGARGLGANVGAAYWSWELGAVEDPEALRGVVRNGADAPMARALAYAAHL